MTLADHPAIFGFERDFAETLHCIPMVVRMKLDLCGIKLTLRQWNRLPMQRRFHMIESACATVSEVMSFRETLLHDITRFTDEAARLVEPVCNKAWTSPKDVPVGINALAEAHAMGPVTPDRWCALTSLQRFALLKLARSHNEHRNFRPAMIEFGLHPAETGQMRS